MLQSKLFIFQRFALPYATGGSAAQRAAGEPEGGVWRAETLCGMKARGYWREKRRFYYAF